MNENSDLLEKRDDLYTEYITLLNMNGEYDNAYNRIMNHNFHLGREVKVRYLLSTELRLLIRLKQKKYRKSNRIS